MSTRDPDPIRADLRRERRRRELKGAVCPVCGESDPLRLEVHEPGGRKNDPAGQVILCRDCHRDQTARQLEVGVDLAGEHGRSALERLVSVLLGLAAMFEALMRSCKDWADRLAAIVAALDRDYPQWRDLPET